jgi:hypothetical protein
MNHKTFPTELTIENDKSIEIINKQTAPQFNGLGYSAITHKSSESGFAAMNNLAHNMPRSNAAFLCVSFQSAVMVRLDREAYAPASYLDYLSANLVQSYHLHFAVNGKTSINLGVINHAA